MKMQCGDCNTPEGAEHTSFCPSRLSIASGGHVDVFARCHGAELVPHGPSYTSLQAENARLNELGECDARRIVCLQAEHARLKGLLGESFRFLAGLNLQDHAIAEQKQQRVLVHRLVAALRTEPLASRRANVK
jgi:hypothetical protein